MFMLQNILPDISMTEDSSQVFELCALKDFFKVRYLVHYLLWTKPCVDLKSVKWHFTVADRFKLGQSQRSLMQSPFMADFNHM